MESEIERRVVALEKEVRWWRAAAILLIGAACFVLLSSGAKNPGTLWAREVNIVDEKGQLALHLGTMESGGFAEFRNKSGQSYLMAYPLPEGSGALILRDRSGETVWQKQGKR